MKKCRQCKQDKAEDFFMKVKGTCEDCKKKKKRKVKRQPSKEEISSFISKCPELFITDVEYRK